MMDTLVQAAQFEAMVGKVNTGFSRIWARALAVSMALPPPTAKTIWAWDRAGCERSISRFS